MTELLLYLVLWLLFITCLLIWIFAVIGSVLGVIVPGNRSNWDNAKLGILAVGAYLIARRFTDNAENTNQRRERQESPGETDRGCDEGSIEQWSDEAVLNEVFGEDRSSR